MKYNAIIFDVDGTLLNTLQDLADSVNRVLKARAFPTHQTDSYRHLLGEGARHLIAKSLPEAQRTEAVISECLLAFREDYGKNWSIHTRPYEGVPELLNALTEKHIRLNVLSNKSHKFVQLCMAHYFSNWTFEMILGAREGIPIKPDPAGANEIADAIALPPSEILYIGDSGVDMRTAVNAGMFPVGVLWGFRSEKELKEHGARKLIKIPMELMDLL